MILTVVNAGGLAEMEKEHQPTSYEQYKDIEKEKSRVEAMKEEGNCL